MFTKLQEIKNVREQKLILLNKEKELTEPLLTDYGTIPEVYQRFKEIVKDRKMSKSRQREVFIFITIWLYQPGSLLGDKMNRRLRSSIANTLDMSTGSTISVIRNDLVFSYKVFKYFRKDIEEIFAEIMERL